VRGTVSAHCCLPRPLYLSLFELVLMTVAMIVPMTTLRKESEPGKSAGGRRRAEH